MTLGDIIREFRAARGMSMEKFAELSGISKGYISMLERNETQRGDAPTPSIKTIATVAAAIGSNFNAVFSSLDDNLSVSLTEDEPNTYPNVHPISKGYYVPHYGRIACGEPILAVEELDERSWVPDNVRADFSLTCVGDSMIGARILDGDFVYIRSMPQVNNGEIAAVVVRDEEVTLKRVYYNQDAQEIFLQAENPTYKTQVYRGEELDHIRILGKAVAFMSPLK